MVEVSLDSRGRALTLCRTLHQRSAIHATSAGDPDGFMGLRPGTVDQRDRLIPVAQSFSGSAQEWVRDLRDIPAFERGIQAGKS